MVRIKRGSGSLAMSLLGTLVTFTACQAGTGSPAAETRREYAQSVLETAVPDPWSTSGQYLGLLRFDANELNRIHQGSKFGHILYVPSTQASGRPSEVSVNAVDEYTWGAASYSIRAKACFVILVQHDIADPRHGINRYGRLRSEMSCLGKAATVETATSASALPE